jgi:alkylation response protein AidB-like acyl-CoA dehydrogenase
MVPELLDLEDPELLATFRRELTRWLDEHSAMAATRTPGGGLDEEVAMTRQNQRWLWDAGWLRYGWPESLGGFGGPPMLRAAVAEEAATRGFVSFSLFALVEVLVPTVAAVAPELAAAYAHDVIAGRGGWCQGFSEPDAGSDLASLRCRAEDKGDYWLVTGQKIWTSFAQFASRIVLLTRTGTTESRHRGITALLVDMDSPGITVRPLRTINDQDEFSETFFDSVRVPKARVIGAEDEGWGVAMRILRSERGAIFWMRSAWLLSQLERLLGQADPSAADDEMIGHAFLSIAALRARSWTTQHRLAASTISTPETSIDKILMASAEQELFDMLPSLSSGDFYVSDRDEAQVWRSDFMFSRAASIYGGAAEIQRNIVADQLLGLRGLA